MSGNSMMHCLANSRILFFLIYHNYKFFTLKVKPLQLMYSHVHAHMEHLLQKHHVIAFAINQHGVHPRRIGSLKTNSCP